MWCYANFPGDDDERLFDMQRLCYSKALWIIVDAARERYFDAEAVLRCYASMSIQVRQLCSIDHRTVQGIHDLIAAWYRFKRRTERLFPLQSDLTEDWCRFATTEARELSASEEFVTGVLDACVYANTEYGCAGEQRAKRVQRERYCEMIRYTLARPQLET
jgi:hypothetical protein